MGVSETVDLAGSDAARAECVADRRMLGAGPGAAHELRRSATAG